MTQAFKVKRGARETETLLFDADGIAVQINGDGSVTIDLYKEAARADALRLRISTDDARSQGLRFKDWARIHGKGV